MALNGKQRAGTRTKASNGALSAGEHPARTNALTASLTFGWRAMLKIKHVPEQLFEVMVGPIMFTYLFGGAIAGSTGDGSRLAPSRWNEP